MRLCYQLPYPPSVNKYWRRRGRGFYVCQEGLDFREAVHTVAPAAPITGRVAVEIHASPPDKRVRDLDNLFKCILDGLQHGGVIANDSQVKRIFAEWTDVSEGGNVVVSVEEF